MAHNLPNDLRLRISRHGIFAAGGAFVPTQEKKKNLHHHFHGIMAFSPLGGPLCPHNKKKKKKKT